MRGGAKVVILKISLEINVCKVSQRCIFHHPAVIDPMDWSVFTFSARVNGGSAMRKKMDAMTTFSP